MRILPVFFLLAACAHTAPLSTDDPFVALPRVSGTVVVPGADRPGTTYVLIYDVATPPPPVGLGTPLTFAVLTADAFRTGGSGQQVYEADFDMSLGGIPDGVTQVLVTALVDTDGDFYPLPPFAEVAGGATCGDLSGAHLSGLDSTLPAPVEVAANEHAEGVTVLVGRTAALERPVFEFLGGSPVINLDDYTGEGLPPSFTLQSTGIQSVFLDEEGEPTEAPFVTIDEQGACGTHFAVTGFDTNGDGILDAHPTYGSSFRNVWPRVLAQYLGEVDRETGVVTPPEEGSIEWSAEFVISPTQTWFGEIPIAPAIDPRTELEVSWVPAAQGTDPETGEVVEVLNGLSDLEGFKAGLPRGAWSVTLINVEGQTWTVPNFISALDPEGPTGPLASQRGILWIE